MEGIPTIHIIISSRVFLILEDIISGRSIELEKVHFLASRSVSLNNTIDRNCDTG